MKVRLYCEGNFRCLRTYSPKSNDQGYEWVSCRYSITYKNSPRLLSDMKRVGGFVCGFCNSPLKVQVEKQKRPLLKLHANGRFKIEYLKTKDLE